MRGVWEGATPLVDDGDYEAKYDETDGNEGKDEGRSVCGAERTIVISPGVCTGVCRLGAWRWGCGRIGLEVTSVLIFVGHERGIGCREMREGEGRTAEEREEYK